MKKIFGVFLGLIVLILPVVVLGSVGVGVGLGKVSVNEPLRPGLIYSLPNLPVLNTGDEPSNYHVIIQYHQNQETNPNMGLRPDASWFKFEPKEFFLQPGQIQQVRIKLNLPLKGVKPGKYFAYLEARPIQKKEAGKTRVGVAAASKLYFEVKPANIISALYYRILSFYQIYSPWTWVVTIIVILAVLIAIFRNHFSLSIGVSLKKKK